MTKPRVALFSLTVWVLGAAGPGCGDDRSRARTDGGADGAALADSAPADSALADAALADSALGDGGPNPDAADGMIMPMDCDDTVGSWRSADGNVWVIVEDGCDISNACDISDGLHVTGTVTSTEVQLDAPRTLVFPYRLEGANWIIVGAGPDGSDLVLTPLSMGASLPPECPTPI